MQLPNPRIESLPLISDRFGMEVAVLRLDEMHPQVSGNKIFKLQPWLHEAKAKGKTGIATRGGAWSNHLLATAASCAASGLKSLGLVRGERPPSPSPTLLDCAALGMELRFVSREEYSKGWTSDDETGMEDWLLVPEGGSGEPGMTGASSIPALAGVDHYTHLLTAAGTGATAAGLLRGSGESQTIIAVPVLKGWHAAYADIAGAAGSFVARLEVQQGFHFGGYAKKTPLLLQFMNEWYRVTGVPTDVVYTGKAFFGFQSLAKAGAFSPSDKVLLVHTGGMQGNRSLPAGSLIF